MGLSDLAAEDRRSLALLTRTMSGPRYECCNWVSACTTPPEEASANLISLLTNQAAFI